MCSISGRFRWAKDHEGFTLIETMVALTILAIVSLSLVPLLVSGAKASILNQDATRAKNLTTARLEQMRSLTYYVSADNGSYTDFLDEYYPNLSTASTTITPTGGTGVYVSSGTVPGQSVSGAYYEVTFTSPKLPTGYTQQVYTEFIAANTASTTSGNTVITPSSSYSSSSTTGGDTPPSLTVGVTVVTSYTTPGGASHAFRAYTELGESSQQAALLVGEAGTTAMSVTANADDGTALSATLGQVGITASMASASTASANASAATFSRIDPSGASTYPGLSGATSSASAPPTSGTTGTVSGSPGTVSSGSASSACGWGSVGPNSVSDVSATVANAQPDAPEDVGSGATPTPAVETQLIGSSGSCGDFAFNNVLDSASTVNPSLYGWSDTAPLVQVPASDGASDVTTQAYVDTPALTFTSGNTVANPVASYSAVDFVKPVEVFPGTSFVTDDTYGQALIVAFLDVTLSCSGTSSTATPSISGSLLVWEQPSATSAGAYQTVWSSSSSVTSLPSPSSITVAYDAGTPVPLSNYITDTWSLGSLQQQSGTAGVSGDHTIPGLISIETQPTVSADGAPVAGTGATITLGRVSCVAEENR